MKEVLHIFSQGECDLFVPTSLQNGDAILRYDGEWKRLSLELMELHLRYTMPNLQEMNSKLGNMGSTGRLEAKCSIYKATKSLV